MPNSVTAKYAEAVAAGRVEEDQAQLSVVSLMAQLEARIVEHRLARKSSALGWLFASRAREQPAIKGLYIYGAVGRGKTMLMDFFFEASPVLRKRRAHFHEFMIDVHERVHAIRQKMRLGEYQGEDPIKIVADALAEEAWLLCFDEFHVTDIADAMILGRLFTQSVRARHRHGGDLERGAGGSLQRRSQPRSVRAVHRAAASSAWTWCGSTRAPTSGWKSSAASRCGTCRRMPRPTRRSTTAWARLTGGHHGTPQDLPLHGRSVHVPRAFMGVARFDFHDLCEQPLAAVDYLRIAHEYHTVILDHVPVMTYDNRNAAKRFIILIDTLYDTNVKLIASAARSPTRSTRPIRATRRWNSTAPPRA